MSTRTTTQQLGPDRGAVRAEDVFDTDVQDLWEACTDPDRLARWIARVSGDLRPAGIVQVVFTSTWTGPMRIETCEPPRHLLLTGQPGGPEESQLELWLTPDEHGTRLVVEERGLPLGGLRFYDAGWRTHLEDLRSCLASGRDVHPDGWTSDRAAASWERRFRELTSGG